MPSPDERTNEESWEVRNLTRSAQVLQLGAPSGRLCVAEGRFCLRALRKSRLTQMEQPARIGDMRFVAFVILIVLISAGWNQSYREHYRSVVGNPGPATRSASAPLATASRQSAPTGQMDRTWQSNAAENPLEKKAHH